MGIGLLPKCLIKIHLIVTLGIGMAVMTSSPNTVCQEKDKNGACVASALREGSDCGYSTKMRDFPSLYTSHKFTPAAPSSFIVKVSENKTFHTSSTEATFIFKPPADGSIAFLTGFELSIYEIPESGAGVPKTACVVFDVSMMLPMAVVDYQRIFEYRRNLSMLTTFYIEMYSLPKPPASHDMYMSYIVSTPPNLDPSKILASEWLTTITIKNYTIMGRGHVDVNFTAPPKEYGFEEFTVVLIEPENVTEVESVTTTSLAHTFSDVNPGTYVVWVIPEDAFYSSDSSDCLCKSKYDECVPCIATSTRPFRITSHNGNVDTNASSYTEDTTEGFQAQILVLPLTSMAIFFIGIILSMVFLKVVPKLRKWKSRNPKPETKDLIRGQCLRMSSQQTHRSPLLISETIKIYLMYYEDNAYFHRVVDCFAELLQTYPQFEVLYAPFYRDQIQEGGASHWSQCGMEEADFIIIVNSDTFSSRTELFKQRAGTPLGSVHDIFEISMTYILSSQHKRQLQRKCIMIRFSYNEKIDILFGLDCIPCFVLINQLDKLIVYIQSKSKHAETAVGKRITDWVPDPEYLRLVAAVHKATNFKKATFPSHSDYIPLKDILKALPNEVDSSIIGNDISSLV